MNAFVILSAYPTLFEAQIIQGLLESHGIQATVLDQHAGGLAVPNAMGGIKVQIMEQDAEEAIAILKERDAMLKGQK